MCYTNNMDIENCLNCGVDTIPGKKYCSKDCMNHFYDRTKPYPHLRNVSAENSRHMLKCISCDICLIPGSGRYKHCSEECCKKYWSMQKHKKSRRYNDPNWKNKATLKLEGRKARREEYEWFMSNWHSSDKILTSLGITWPHFNKIKKALQLEPRISGHNLTHFYSPEEYERIKNHSFPEVAIVPPPGYKTRKQIEEIFFINIDKKIGRWRIKPKFKKWRGQNKLIRNIYRPEDIVEWLEEVHRIKVKKVEDKKIRTKEKRERLYKEKVAKAYKAIEGLDVVNSTEAATILGVANSRPLLQDKCIKVLRKCYYLRSDVEIVKEERNKKQAKIKQTKLRPDDWTSWQSYEKKKKEQLELFLSEGYVRGTRAYKDIAVKNNFIYWEKHDNNNIVHFECIKCHQNMPYYDFYLDATYNRGRRNDCKFCSKKNGPQKGLKRTRSRFGSIFVGVGIKQSLTKKSEVYCTLSTTQLWYMIEKHLGYNQEQLLQHIESKFTKRMKWSNHGRPTKPNQFRWQLDHIKPRNSFSYSSIEDKDFKECWALENLIPIEAKMNNYKSDKKLMHRVNADLRKALKTGEDNSLTKHLPYTAKQLQEHFISLGVNVEEYGSTWTIDHIVPQAAKPFQSFQCSNFQELLALENLQPLTKLANSTKGSKYKDKFWFHNYEC